MYVISSLMLTDKQTNEQSVRGTPLESVSGAQDFDMPLEKGNSVSSTVSKQQSVGVQQSTAVDPSEVPLPKEKDVPLGTYVYA